MKPKVDRIQANKEEAKRDAIDFIKAWAKVRVEEYQEPRRVGTKKGDPIGFSKTKLYAAILCALYPHSLKLKGIAKIAGVSQRVLLTWRTQENFANEMEAQFTVMGKKMAKFIERLIRHTHIKEFKAEGSISSTRNGILRILRSEEKYIEAIKKASEQKIKKVILLDDTEEVLTDDPFRTAVYYIRMFSVLDGRLCAPFVESLKKHADENDYYYILLMEFTLKLAYIHDEQSLRKWEATPEFLEITKLHIEKDIEVLTDPETWKQGLDSPEKKKAILESATMMKEFIFAKLDVLAS